MQVYHYLFVEQAGNECKGQLAQGRGWLAGVYVYNLILVDVAQEVEESLGYIPQLVKEVAVDVRLQPTTFMFPPVNTPLVFVQHGGDASLRAA